MSEEGKKLNSENVVNCQDSNDVNAPKRGKKKGEPTQLVSFYLQPQLVAAIEANAEKKTAGNKSAFLRKLLQGEMILE